MPFLQTKQVVLLTYASILRFIGEMWKPSLLFMTLSSMMTSPSLIHYCATSHCNQLGLRMLFEKFLMENNRLQTFTLSDLEIKAIKRVFQVPPIS